jgi:hypothetical protein
VELCHMVPKGVLELGGPRDFSSSAWGRSGGKLSLCRSAPSEYDVVAGQPGMKN